MTSPSGKDVVYGLTAIAEIAETSPEGVCWLHARGRIPVAKIDKGYIANRSAVLAAKAAGQFGSKSGARKVKRELAEETA